VQTADVIRLPVAYQAAEHALAELVAAIELVASGRARRVTVSGIPGVDSVASEALLDAQAAHVAFCLRRSPGHAPAVVVGPLER
jgi:hypothetical protein